MKRALDLALCALGLPAWYRRRNRDCLPILMYHGVVEQRLSPFCWHQLPLEQFERQMRWVARTYQVLPLAEALDRLYAGSLPPRALAITFDDGFRNNLELAAPVLEKHGLPATVFLITDLVGTQEVPWPDRLYLAVRAARGRTLDATVLDLEPIELGDEAEQERALAACLSRLKVLPDEERRSALERLLASLHLEAPPEPGPFGLMDWDEIRSLSREGLIGFGAHTRRHRLLSRLRDEEVSAEVHASHARVREELGQEPRVFAYPNGRPIDFDERAERAVREAGIPYALGTHEALASVRSAPTALPRICVGSDLPFPRFKLLVSGAWQALRG